MALPALPPAERGLVPGSHDALQSPAHGCWLRRGLGRCGPFFPEPEASEVGEDRGLLHLALPLCCLLPAGGGDGEKSIAGGDGDGRASVSPLPMASLAPRGNSLLVKNNPLLARRPFPSFR